MLVQVFAFQKSLFFLQLLYVTADPLAQVTQQFREHLLERSVYSLITPGNRNLEGGSHASEVILYTQLLTEASCLKRKDCVLNLSSACQPGMFLFRQDNSFHLSQLYFLFHGKPSPSVTIHVLNEVHFRVFLIDLVMVKFTLHTCVYFEICELLQVLTFDILMVKCCLFVFFFICRLTIPSLI